MCLTCCIGKINYLGVYKLDSQSQVNSVAPPLSHKRVTLPHVCRSHSAVERPESTTHILFNFWKLNSRHLIRHLLDHQNSRFHVHWKRFWQNHPMSTSCIRTKSRLFRALELKTTFRTLMCAIRFIITQSM